MEVAHTQTPTEHVFTVETRAPVAATKNRAAVEGTYERVTWGKPLPRTAGKNGKQRDLTDAEFLAMVREQLQGRYKQPISIVGRER